MQVVGYISTHYRPVREAFSDAQRARSADVFVQPDDRYVVRGSRGREHIFEPDGERFLAR
jgi:filamentous hemagglutinin